MNIRQGDLLFKKVDEEVSGKKLQSITIAEGEFTGHHHVLIAETNGFLLGDKSKFTVKGKAKLTHPEHATIDFSEGTYMVITEREHDYINDELVKVRD